MIKELSELFPENDKICILEKNGFKIQRNNEKNEVVGGDIYTPSKYLIDGISASIDEKFKELLKSKIQKRIFPEYYNNL